MASGVGSVKFDKRIEGKVALVTGASSGIGAATAIELSAAGFSSLVLVARNAEGLSETETSCKEAGAKSILTLARDLENPKDVCEGIIDQTIKRFGRLDVVVNNAGFCVKSRVRDMKVEDIESHMSVHLLTPMMLTKFALPHLEKTKGSLIYMASIAGTSLYPKDMGIYG